MPAVADPVLEVLDSEIAAVRDRLRRVEAARKEVVQRGSNGHVEATPEKAVVKVQRQRKPRASKPAGTGGRSAQILTLIQERPGITAGEIATTLGVIKTQPFAILRKFIAEGKIEKVGKGYEPKQTENVTSTTTGLEGVLGG